MKPPRTPEEQLRRVLLVAKLDGISLMVIASLAVLLSLALGDYVGLFVAVVVVISGGLGRVASSCCAVMPTACAASSAAS